MRQDMFVMILMVASLNAEAVLVGETVELKGACPVFIDAVPLDVHWTSMGLVLHRNRTVGCGKRCSLQSDGALRLTNAQLKDSGQYRQEVFNQRGRIICKKEFKLIVYGHAHLRKRWTPLGLSLVLVLVLVLVFIVIIFIRKKWGLSVTNQRRNTDAPCLEENIYVPMFRASELKIQGQKPSQGETDKTQNQTQTPTEAEEDIYV